ncbi:hypothetical protein QUB00_23735 [Microcoleus sp. F8_C2]
MGSGFKPILSGNAPKCDRIAVMPPSAIEFSSCVQVRSNFRHASKCDRIFVMRPSAIELP